MIRFTRLSLIVFAVAALGVAALGAVLVGLNTTDKNTGLYCVAVASQYNGATVAQLGVGNSSKTLISTSVPNAAYDATRGSYVAHGTDSPVWFSDHWVYHCDVDTSFNDAAPGLATWLISKGGATLADGSASLGKVPTAGVAAALPAN